MGLVKMLTVDYLKLLREGFPELTPVFEMVHHKTTFAAFYFSHEDVRRDTHTNPNLYGSHHFTASLTDYSRVLEELRALHEDVRKGDIDEDFEARAPARLLTFMVRFMPVEMDHLHVLLEKSHGLSRFKRVWVKLSEDLLAHLWGDCVWCSDRVGGEVRHVKLDKSFPSELKYVYLKVVDLPTLRKVILCDSGTLQLRRLEREELAELQGYFKWHRYPSYQTWCACNQALR